MKKQKPKFPLRLVITVIFIFIILFAVRYAAERLMNVDYFRIKEIIFSENNLSDLSYLKGHNIFLVDLNRESQFLLQKFPGYKKIRIIRVFPDRLYVDFVKRLPAAYVRLYRLFYVDSDGVLFDAPALSLVPELALISGLDTKIFGPKSGIRYDIKELKVALEIIREIRSNKVFRDYQLKKIDLANLSNVTVNLSFVLPQPDNAGDNAAAVNDFLEVKIGPDNIRDKINILSSLLSQVNNERFNIKYIDLRFKEPVIKLKDADNNQRR